MEVKDSRRQNNIKKLKGGVDFIFWGINLTPLYLSLHQFFPIIQCTSFLPTKIEEKNPQIHFRQHNNARSPLY